MSRRLAPLVGTVLLGTLALVVPAVVPASGTVAGAEQARVAAAADAAYSETKTLTRTFVDSRGTAVEQASNTVTVTADQTSDLRGRQRVRISWSGAHPSGGRASTPFGVRGMQQEYPVVVMQCRGRDSPELPVSKQVRPETCWTSSFSQRSQLQKSTALESTWTRDLHADPADKERVSGIDPFPSAEICPTADTADYATHLTAFEAAGGTTYPACSSETMPPEANVDGALPPAEIAAFTDLDGNGSTQFEVRSDLENESLGCSSDVACSIVVVPIIGLSCQQAANPPTRIDKECRLTGQHPPGESNFSNLGIDQAVGPGLWWSESNWRNRFSIPITFSLPPDVCNILDPRQPVGFYGSELLAQAALQWAPAYCLDDERFKFELNLTSDIAGFNLMQTGQIPAAVVSSAQPKETTDPVGYAPTALTGFGIGYVVDKPGNAGDVTNLRLNARLIAKLLTQSYLGSDLGRKHPGIEGNPLGIMADPEFYELNRGLSRNPQEAGAALLSLADSSDVILQLTQYIAEDEAAMAFIGGEPDPSGMVVNPSYRDIELPRREWPLLDDFVPETQDECRQENPAIYFNQLASPVSRLRQISLALLDGWPNIQTRCDFDPSTSRFKTGRVDVQSFGSRFVLGVVSLGDAARFGIRVAALRTRGATYVAPTPAAIGAAVGLSEQPRPRAPFVLDQTDVARSTKAYPGAMVVYTAAKTRGLDQAYADRVAQFIRISTTEGQRPGTGNGRLPAGYVPIRRTGPTADLWTSAQAVADAVEAQRPARTDETDEEPDPGSGPLAPGGAPSTDTGTDSGTGPLDVPGSTDPTAPPTSAPSDPPLTVATEPIATVATDADHSGMMGKFFPALLVVGLLALLYTLGSRFFVRPPRRSS